MMINKPQFEKGLDGLRKVSIAPEKKEAIFNSLSRYAEKHPVMPAIAPYVAFLKTIKGLIPVSWR